MLLGIIHATPFYQNLHCYPLTSSKNLRPKISVAYFKKLFQSIFFPKFLQSMVILRFKKRFSKQNSVIRLKSNILAPPKFLG